MRSGIDFRATLRTALALAAGTVIGASALALVSALVLTGCTDGALSSAGVLGLLSVSRSRLEAWDPDHLTVPEFTGPGALDLA